MLGDDRGQSIQVGAVLLFGILIIGLAFAQTVVVPAENEGVEFNGYVETTEDLVTLRNDVLAAGVQGGPRAQSVQTGVRYPSRAVLINPGPSVGSLRTTSPENVTVSGVEAVSGEPANVRGIWDTSPSARGPQNFSTRSVRFTPAYNNIDVPPVEVSAEGAYRLTDNGPLSLTSRTFVTGNRITLVTVEGDLRSSALTTSVAATPASVATRSVTLTGTGSEFIVTLPVPGNGSVAAATAWNNSTAAQSLRDNPNVLTTAVNGSRVDITFDGSRTYELRLAHVIVHDRGDSGVDADAEPQYLVPLDANGTEVPTIGSKRLSVEVRDRYNNPVEGVDVAFSASSGTITSGSTVTTDSAGHASVAFDIDDAADTAEITAVIDDQGVPPYNSTTIEVVRQGTGGEGGSINPAGGNDLALRSSDLADAGGSPTDKQSEVESVRVSFQNFDTSNPKNITKVKLSFYSVDAQSGSRDPSPDSATFDPVGSGPTLTLDTGGDFEDSTLVFSPGQTRDVVMRFYENQNGGGSTFEPQRGDFYVLNVFIDVNGDGVGDTSATYFIAPR